jgi:hypothetical protein
VDRVDLQHPHPADGGQYVRFVSSSRRPIETLRREEERTGGGKGKAKHARNILQGWRGVDAQPIASDAAREPLNTSFVALRRLSGVIVFEALIIASTVQRRV